MDSIWIKDNLPTKNAVTSETRPKEFSKIREYTRKPLHFLLYKERTKATFLLDPAPPLLNNHLLLTNKNKPSEVIFLKGPTISPIFLSEKESVVLLHELPDSLLRYLLTISILLLDGCHTIRTHTDYVTQLMVKLIILSGNDCLGKSFWTLNLLEIFRINVNTIYLFYIEQYLLIKG